MVLYGKPLSRANAQVSRPAVTKQVTVAPKSEQIHCQCTIFYLINTSQDLHMNNSQQPKNVAAPRDLNACSYTVSIGKEETEIASKSVQENMKASAQSREVEMPISMVRAIAFGTPLPGFGISSATWVDLMRRSQLCLQCPRCKKLRRMLTAILLTRQ